MPERAEYGLTENDVSFDTREDKFLDVDESVEGVKENPINHTLSTFKKEFIRNERLAFDLFSQLNDLLIKFSTIISANPWYEEMDIVKLMDTVLDRYRNWMTIMRYNVLLGKEKMQEVEKVVTENYTSNVQIENLKAEMKLKLDELESGWYESKCQMVGPYKRVTIPRKIRDIQMGDIVRFRKGDIKALTNYVEEEDEGK